MKKQLIFNNINELQEYIAEANINISDLEIFENSKSTILESKIDAPKIREMTVGFASLSDNPKITAQIGEANILYVDDIIINENSCMPVKVEILGRSLLLNVCNENGISHANLNVAINERTRYNVLFEIKKKESENSLMQISNNLIES